MPVVDQGILPRSEPLTVFESRMNAMPAAGLDEIRAAKRKP